MVRGHFSGGDGLVVVHAFVDDADEHGAGAELRIIEVEVALRVGLGVGDRLHAALQLDEDHVGACGYLAGGAVFHCAV